MRLLAIAIVVCLGLTVSAGAGADDLTRSDVENFLGALRELRDEVGDYHDVSADDVDAPHSFGESLALAQESDADISEIARNHDFSDPQELAEVGDRVMAAYLALTVGEQDTALRGQLELARKTLESHPTLTAQQKEMALKQMSEAMAGFNELGSKASAADKAVVSEYVDEIDTTLRTPPEAE